jgi:HSP20 family molecular chaperone IbpA
MSLFDTLIPSFNLVAVRRESPAPAGGQTVVPAYDIKENTDAFGLTVHLPGVTKEGLELTAEAGVFTIRGTRAWKQPEGWTTLYRESTDAPFELALTHDNTLDVDKIHAELKEGVLRVSLPKTEAVKPRKIAVA